MDVAREGRFSKLLASYVESSAGWAVGVCVFTSSTAAQSLVHDFVGPIPRAHLGIRVANAGDVNADGKLDVLISAEGNFTFGVNGFVTVRSGANWSVLHQFSGGAQNLGMAIAGLGDVNGDARSDFLFSDTHSSTAVRVHSGLDGAEIYSIPWGMHFFYTSAGVAVPGDISGDGIADFVLGDHGGSRVEAFSGANGASLWSATGSPGSAFGYVVHGGADVDGDGWPDVIVGAPGDDSAGEDAGSIRVLSGLDGSTIHERTGSAPDELFGTGVLIVPDLDRDSRAEFLVCSAVYGAGGAKLRSFSGAGGSLLYVIELEPLAEGFISPDEFALLGDIDGNGYSDVAVGDGRDGRGRALVLSGIDGRLIQRFEGEYGDGDGDHLGIDIAGLGDLDLDGHPEVIIGADGRDDAGFGSGGATIWSIPANPPESFCIAAPNSVGPGARIFASGSMHVDYENLALYAERCPPQQFGLFFYGANWTQVPFFDGYLCVRSPHFRLKPPTQIDGNGVAFKALDFRNPPVGSGPGEILPGSTWSFQFWYRDPAAGGTGANTSGGLEIVFGG